MEANTTMTICPNGHPYDTAKYSCCPQCGSPAGAFPRTEPVGGAGGGTVGAFGPTVAPDTPDAFGTPTVPGDMLSNGTDYQADPVVGWLVCVEGPVRGTDYRIHSGYNYIGRDSGDICIRGDNQISRQNHAMIAYDSTDRIYFVGPAAGRNLIKVNGKTVLNAVEIHSYDTISIGTTKLIFVALCGDQFSWPTEGSTDGR